MENLILLTIVMILIGISLYDLFMLFQNRSEKENVESLQKEIYKPTVFNKILSYLILIAVLVFTLVVIFLRSDADWGVYLDYLR